MIREWLSRTVASALIIGASLFVGTQNASAWGHHHHHHYGYGWGGVSYSGFGYSYRPWGAYGVGFGPVYSSYYSTGFYPAASFYSYNIPIYRYAAYHSFPLATPYYTSRVYYSPVYYTPPVVYSTYLPLCASNTVSEPSVSSTVLNVSPNVTRLNFAANRQIAPQSSVASTQVPSTTTPPRHWLTSAVELIDNMAEFGGSKEGLQACEQLINVRENLPSSIYLRAAVFAAAESKPADTVSKYLELAQRSGSKLNGSELPTGSFRTYIAKFSKGSVDDILNRIAEKAIKQNQPTNELRALAGLLALDGQAKRSARFLEAANSGPTDSNSGTMIAALPTK